MKKLNEAVIEALVRSNEGDYRLILENPQKYGLAAVQRASEWMQDVAHHRNPDGTIRVFVEEGDPTPAPTHYTVNGHMLEIVAEPVMIDGSRVDVVRCPDGKYDIIRRQGREYYNASMLGWVANSDAASDACYLTAAAAIAERAELARRAGGAA